MTNVQAATCIDAAGGIFEADVCPGTPPVSPPADSPVSPPADSPVSPPADPPVSPIRDDADIVNFGEGVSLIDPTGNKTIPQIFQALLDILMVFAVPIILFFIIWAGFLYVTAAGNAEQIKKAHNALLYALIGGLLVLGANVLLAVISNTIKAFI